VLVLIGLGLILIWTISLPVPAKVVDGQVITDAAEAATIRGNQTIVYQPVAESTTTPWTVIAVISVLAFFVSWLVRDRLSEQRARQSLIAAWVISLPLIVMLILREPEVDFGRVLTWFLPVALGFLIVGGLILNYIASKSATEISRILGGVLLILAFASFVIPMEFYLRFFLVFLAIFGLAAPTFGGEGAGRRRFLGAWAGTVVIYAFFMVLITAPSGVDAPRSFFIEGLGLTFILAISAIVLSFPIGVVLALGRTSTMPIFRLMSTTYIEIIRGVPLITWLIVAFFMLPIAVPPGVEVGDFARALVALTFFNAAYTAENIRGGLQSIPKGQYEASKAMGMTTAQMTIFITLPQALRAVIPALVGGTIALFKDTSLVTVVGLFDFLHIARAVIPAQTTPFGMVGSIKETLLFAAIVYWIFTFSFSRISLRLEKKLGIGER
jgi:general L-amino acid transport system permease protein